MNLDPQLAKSLDRARDIMCIIDAAFVGRSFQGDRGEIQVEQVFQSLDDELAVLKDAGLPPTNPRAAMPRKEWEIRFLRAFENFINVCKDYWAEAVKWKNCLQASTDRGKTQIDANRASDIWRERYHAAVRNLQTLGQDIDRTIPRSSQSSTNEKAIAHVKAVESQQVAPAAMPQPQSPAVRPSWGAGTGWPFIETHKREIERRDNEQLEAGPLKDLRDQAMASYGAMREVFCGQHHGVAKSVSTYAKAISIFARTSQLRALEQGVANDNQPRAYAIHVLKTARDAEVEEVEKLLLALLESEKQMIPGACEPCPWNNVLGEITDVGLAAMGFMSGLEATKRLIAADPLDKSPEELVSVCMQRCLQHIQMLLILANPPAQLEHNWQEQANGYYDFLVAELQRLVERGQGTGWDQLETWNYLCGVSRFLRQLVGQNNSWPTVWLKMRGKLPTPTSPGGFDALEEEVWTHLARLQNQGEPIAAPPILSKPGDQGGSNNGPQHSAQSIAEIVEVLEWIEAHPDSIWNEGARTSTGPGQTLQQKEALASYPALPARLFQLYEKWEETIRQDKLLDFRLATTVMLPRLSAFGHDFLLKDRTRRDAADSKDGQPTVFSAEEKAKVAPKDPSVNQKAAKAPSNNIRLSEWGIGFDPITGWHVFRQTQTGWRYARRKLKEPRGVLAHALDALLNNKGVLAKSDLNTFYKGSAARPKNINYVLSRLRKLILEGMGIGDDAKINVIPKSQGGWHLKIRIGQAEKTDSDYSNANPELSFIACD